MTIEELDKHISDAIDYAKPRNTRDFVLAAIASYALASPDLQTPALSGRIASIAAAKIDKMHGMLS